MRVRLSDSTTPAMHRYVVAYLIAALAAILFAMLYVSRELPSYAWDRTFYWDTFRDAGSVAGRDFVLFLRALRESVAKYEYNALGVVPLLPVYFLFGGDRTVYVAAVCALYAVPAAFVAARLASNRDRGAFPGGLAIGSALLMPVFWNAAMRGMIDVIGLITLGISAILIWNTRFLTQASLRLSLLLGFLFWLTFGLRRWYAFSLVALIALSMLAAAIVLVRSRTDAGSPPFRARALKTFDNWLYAGSTALLWLVLFQPYVFSAILHSNYAKLFSAYQLPVTEQIAFYGAEFGPVILFFVVLGLAFDLRNGRWKGPFFLLAAILTAVLFGRVQAPAVQHLLPIALMVFPSCYTGISLAWERLPGLLRWIVPLVLVVNFTNNFLPEPGGPLQAVRKLLGGPRYAPLSLENYGEYQRLNKDLLALGDGKTFAVFASSWDLTATLLTAMEPKLRRKLIPVGEVDLRDELRLEAMAADYVLIGRPTPFHLHPDSQRVISIPAEEIATGTGIGTSYASTGRQYRLSGGITAELYRRLRPIPQGDITALQNKFYAIYPQWKTSKPSPE